MNVIDDRERGSAGQAQGGGMREGWQIRRLGDVCSLLNRGVSPAYLEKGGVCVLNQKCIRNHEVSYEPARRHDDAEKKVAEERFIQRGDVLVNSTGTGTLGRVAQVRNEPEEATTVDSHVTIVRAKPDLFHLEFFGYMLVVIEEAIKEAGDGCGGQTELARSVLAERFYVSYPESLVEQQRIVALLDEAFAGLATAKANTERNLRSARAIIESHLQHVFSQRGEGWVEKSLKEICEKITDGTHQTPKYFSEGIVFLSSRNVTSGKIDWGNVKYIDNAQHLEMHRRVAPRRGDILLAKNGTTGVAAIVDRDTVFDIYVSLAHIRPLPVIRPQLLLHFINSPVAKVQFNQRLKGVGVPNLHLEEIREVRLHFPEDLMAQDCLVAEVDELLEETQRLTRLYERKLAALEELKKSLLHQAFNGEL
jgi:type I restriction enzyme S subunit